MEDQEKKTYILYYQRKLEFSFQFEIFGSLIQTTYKSTNMFTQTYLITQNWIHFRQFHWPIDFVEHVRRTNSGQSKDFNSPVRQKVLHQQPW